MGDDQFFGNIRLNADAVLNEGDDIIISMKNIHKTYLLGIEGVAALRGVSLTIKKGEYVSIFGTSGGGKTTMLNIIGTIDKPTKGDMFLCDTRVTSTTTDKELARIRLAKIGFVFQTFNLLSALTAVENVEMPMILLGELNAAERRERAISLLEKVGMGARLDHIPAQLSGGEQQRVTIARALANQPDLLLLDEPTGDLDTENTANVMRLLLKLNKEDGITLVMVTHDVALKNFADRIVWMRDGKIARIEPIQKLRKEANSNLKRVMKSIDEKKKNGTKKGVKQPVGVTETRQPLQYEVVNAVYEGIEPQFNVGNNIAKGNGKKDSNKTKSKTNNKKKQKKENDSDNEEISSSTSTELIPKKNKKTKKSKGEI